MDVNPILNPEEPRFDASKIRTGSITADKLVVKPSSGATGLAQFISPGVTLDHLNPTPSVRLNPDGTVTIHRPESPS